MDDQFPKGPSLDLRHGSGEARDPGPPAAQSPHGWNTKSRIQKLVHRSHRLLNLGHLLLGGTTAARSYAAHVLIKALFECEESISMQINMEIK